MTRPELKEDALITREDLERHPVWVRARDYDQDEPWYESCDEQTFRPWIAELPAKSDSQFPFFRLAAVIRFANGDQFPGKLNSVSPQWDNPLPPRKMRDGNYAPSKQWSARRGGSPLSILALQSPVIFIAGKSFDFHLRRNPENRAAQVKGFFEAVGLAPAQVFPIEFASSPAYFDGIVSGRLEGFFSFPLDKPYEIDRGDGFLS